MAYRFDRPDEPVEAAVQRIAAKLLSSATAAAASPPGDGTSAIFPIRKSLKKTRALLRLVRPHVHGFSALNDELRRIGHLISIQRDAEVLPETTAFLALDADTPTAAALENLAARLRSAVPDGGSTALPEVRSRLETLAREIRHVRVTGDGFDPLSRGLVDTLARALRAERRMRRSDGEERIEASHDWRKRTKDHWYHARLLSPIWPEEMAVHTAEADRIARALGQHRDIAALVAVSAGSGLPAPEMALVSARANEVSDALETEARRRFARITAGGPEALAARWRPWWTLWRDGTAP